MRVLVRQELAGRCGPCSDPRVRQRWDAYEPGSVVETVILGHALAVAVKGTADDWAGYIGSTEEGEQAVARGGQKLTKAVAAAVFDDCVLGCGVYRP